MNKFFLSILPLLCLIFVTILMVSITDISNMVYGQPATAETAATPSITGETPTVAYSSRAGLAVTNDVVFYRKFREYLYDKDYLDVEDRVEADKTDPEKIPEALKGAERYFIYNKNQSKGKNQETVAVYDDANQLTQWETADKLPFSFILYRKDYTRGGPAGLLLKKEFYLSSKLKNKIKGYQSPGKPIRTGYYDYIYNEGDKLIRLNKYGWTLYKPDAALKDENLQYELKGSYEYEYEGDDLKSFTVFSKDGTKVEKYVFEQGGVKNKPRPGDPIVGSINNNISVFQVARYERYLENTGELDYFLRFKDEAHPDTKQPCRKAVKWDANLIITQTFYYPKDTLALTQGSITTPEIVSDNPSISTGSSAVSPTTSSAVSTSS